MSRVLVIPDLHAPFVHRDALDFLVEVRSLFRTNMCLLLGDELDNHAQSTYVIDADGFSAGHELDRGIEVLRGFYKEFPGNPDEPTLICKSNHPRRTFARMESSGIPKKFWRRYSDVIEAPLNWKWAWHHEIDGVIYEHGHLAGGGGSCPHLNHAAKNMRSTVIGHHHSVFGLEWQKSPYTTIFGMACGWLGDEKAYAMAYGRGHKRKPILGCGVVIDGTNPILLRMETNKRGRWNGKVGFNAEQV